MSLNSVSILEVRVEGNFLNIMKATGNLTADIIHPTEKKTIPPIIKYKSKISVLTTFIKH